MSQETTQKMTIEQQKELHQHLKNLLKLKRFCREAGLSTYHLKDVILDVIEEGEKYNLI